MIQRKPAYKIWISQLSIGQMQKEPGEFGSQFIIVKDKNISRVSIVATVVDTFVKPESGFSSISLDDGSGTVNVKAFKDDLSLLENIKVGDIVSVFGRLREYNDERYILPELVKVLDNPNWELVRKLELINEYGKPEEIKDDGKEMIEVATEQGTVVEEVSGSSSDIRNRVLSLVEHAGPDGADYSKFAEVLKLSDEEIDGVLKELLSEGEIYQSRPGKYKVI
ncbi:MAG: OB-fold nucleic acid binding domain-containing protein [Candidatus Nanoarchaeia archaeon]|nr:OB-fold nucleic acid binding domain-containing protein [Candidatus Nanoarchaeia archaeon]